MLIIIVSIESKTLKLKTLKYLHAVYKNTDTAKFKDTKTSTDC